MTKPTCRTLASVLLLGASLLGSAFSVAAQTGATMQTSSSPYPTVDLSAEASQSAPNDQAQATVFYEADNKEPAKLAKQVNDVIDKALDYIRKQEGIDARTASVSTYPTYDKQKISGWRMRTEIRLESRDIPALSALLATLQQKYELGVAGVNMHPASETRNAAADAAVTAAIRVFETRAASIAKTLNKQYRLQRLSINYGNTMPIQPVRYESAMLKSSGAMPLESGDTEITVSVNGTIELLD